MRIILAVLAFIALLNQNLCGQATVNFTIDAKQNVQPISRLIYGVNQPIGGVWANLTFARLGGNRLTAYNWVNNASNAGSDYRYQSDDYLGGGNTPGGAVLPTLQNAARQNAAALITIPTNGYVSADKNGSVDIHDPARFTTRFKPEAAAKGSPFTLTPDPRAPVVYQDEFVNWIKSKFPYGQSDPNRPIYFQLDNEPDLWSETHREVHPDPVSYAEMLQKTIAYSIAIKNVEPRAIIYGPVNYGWAGIVNLQSAKDANGRDFEAFYLKGLARAEGSAGKRLLDVLDVHWYPEATGDGGRITEAKITPGVIAARLQAPRSLWDPAYFETSWITRSTRGPINLIPRLQKIIAENYPGTRLSISEYNYGGGGDISGAIAEADVLGIFGKLNLFSANEWPLNPNEPFIAAAFAMYRNFDGENSTFGDTSISAATDDITATSIYASLDSGNPNQMIVIAINKTAAPVVANFQLKKAQPFRRIEIYQLTGANSQPTSAGQLSLKNLPRFTYKMPPYSVSTLRLTSAAR